MKRDEGAALVLRGELRPVVERERVRRPVRREIHDRLDLLVAIADRLAAIAAVLGREHQLLLRGVEVALWPPVVAALHDPEQLLRRKIRALLWRVEPRPVVAELVAPVLRGVELPRCVERDADGVANARGVAASG